MTLTRSNLLPIIFATIILVIFFSFSPDRKNEGSLKTNYFQYKIVYASNPSFLENLVTTEIRADWQPLGGVSIDSKGELYQALTK